MRRSGSREVGKSGSRNAGTLASRRPDLPTSRLLSAFKQIVGMPDYTRYLEHAREYHADCPLLSEREFYDQYIAARYGSGATRCC